MVAVPVADSCCPSGGSSAISASDLVASYALGRCPRVAHDAPWVPASGARCPALVGFPGHRAPLGEGAGTPCATRHRLALDPALEAQQVLVAIERVVVGTRPRRRGIAGESVITEGTLQDALAAGQAGEPLLQSVHLRRRNLADQDADRAVGRLLTRDGPQPG